MSQKPSVHTMVEANLRSMDTALNAMVAGGVVSPQAALLVLALERHFNNTPQGHFALVTMSDEDMREVVRGKDVSAITAYLETTPATAELLKTLDIRYEDRTRFGGLQSVALRELTQAGLVESFYVDDAQDPGVSVGTMGVSGNLKPVIRVLRICWSAFHEVTASVESSLGE